MYRGNPSRSVAVTPKDSIRCRPAAPTGVEGGCYGGEDIYMEWIWDAHGGQSDPATDSSETDEETVSGEGYVDHFNLYRNGKLFNQVRRDAGRPYESSYREGVVFYEWSGTMPVPEYETYYTCWVTAVAPDGTESPASRKISVYAEADRDHEIYSYSAMYTEESVWDKQAHEYKEYKGMRILISGMGYDRYEYQRKIAGASDDTYKKVTLTEFSDESFSMDETVTEGKVYTYKVTGITSKGERSEPLEFSVAATDDIADFGSTPGGSRPEFRTWTASGESISFHFNKYGSGSYKLLRDGAVIKTWSKAADDTFYTDTPDSDGVYRYQLVWTSKKYPTLTAKSVVKTFVKDTTDPDPDTFDKVPGKPEVFIRPLKYDDGTAYAAMLSWRPSKTGGEAEGYIIYRTDGGHVNTYDWEHSLSRLNPRRYSPWEGEPAMGRYWCVKGDVTAYQIDHIVRSASGYEWEEGDMSDLAPHEFWIVPYNSAGMGEKSNVVVLENDGDNLQDPDDSEAPGAPTSVRAGIGWIKGQYSMEEDAQVRLVWGAPENGGGFDCYEVSFDWEGADEPETWTVSPDSVLEAVFSGRDHYMEDYIGKTCTMTVSTVQKKTGVKTASEPVQVTLLSIPYLKAEAAGPTSVQLTWGDLQYYDKTPIDEYQVWRRANASPWQKVKTLAGDAEKEWTDTGLWSKTKYEYYLAAVDENGIEHKSSTREVELTARSAAVNVPSNLSAKRVKGDVILSWTPPEGGSLPVYYRLEYQTPDKDPEEDYWNGFDLDAFGYSTGIGIPSWQYDPGSGYAASGLGDYAGETIRLRLRAVAEGHSWGDPGDWIEFTMPAADTIKHEENPAQRLEIQAVPGDGKVTVSWTEPAGSASGASKATWYELIRTWKGGSGTLGVVMTFAAGKGTYEYVDDDLENGREYTYELHPCNSYYRRDSYYNYYWYDPLCYMTQKTVIPNGKTTDEKIADNVKAMAQELIAARPADLSDMTDEYHSRVMELKENYAGLTAYQKKLIGTDMCAAIEELTGDVVHYDKSVKYAGDQRIADAEDLISVLDAFNGSYPADDPQFAAWEQAATAAREAYEAVPDEEKELVSNSGILFDHEKRIRQKKKEADDQAKAAALSAKLAALDPDSISADTLTDEVERQIADLRWEYDLMTKAQKAKVDPAALDKLFACEEKINIAHGLDHVHQMSYVSAEQPTCTKGGHIGYYQCSKCGRCFTDAAGQQEIERADTVLPADPAAHDWDDWKITTAPTYTQGGIEERVCREDPAHRESRSVPASGHNWDEGTVVKEATAEEDGEIVFACRDCRLSRTARIEWGGEGACARVADHEWGEGELVKAPTCSEPGEMKYICTKCHVSIKYDVEIDPNAHDWSDWTVTKAETCVDSGSKERVCGLCGQKETEIIDPAGHSWGPGTVIEEPTCAHTGLTLFKCDVCGETKTEITPVTEDHDWGEWYVILRPTPTQAGWEERVCSVSDEHRDLRAIPPLTVRLAKTSYTYNGKVKKPAVTVRDRDVTLGSGFYTVKYASGRCNVGAYKVTVTMKGIYEGAKSLTFKINPKGTALARLAPAKKALTVRWKRQAARMKKARVTGYQIQVSTSKTFKSGNKSVKVKGYKKTSVKVPKLKAKKKYYVRIRTYLKTGGKTYYSPWSRKKYAKTK